MQRVRQCKNEWKNFNIDLVKCHESAFLRNFNSEMHSFFFFKCRAKAREGS